MAMIPAEDEATIDAMTAYGGLFVRTLAECCHTADHINYSRLRMAFPKLWKQYAKMARMARRP